jgi:SAM-dependent methyltransferase
MSLRYLLGPVSPSRAHDWQAERQAGRCLAFNASGSADVTVAPGDSWQDLLVRLPEGWRPDFIALDLGYTSVPACLWDAPVPLVALAPDWQLQWHFLRRFLPLCSVVLTDAAGVAALHKQGITQARQAHLFGLQGLFTGAPAAEDAPKEIDLLFVGNLHPAVQRQRLPWLARLARLGGRWRVHVAQGVHGEEYRKLLLRSRIVFNRSVRGEWNLRVGEACSCGALLFSEAGNAEMAPVWKHGENCVLYADDDLEALLGRYLADEPERARIAGQGRLTPRRFTFAAAWEQELAALEATWPEVLARHASRPALPPREALLTRTWQALGAADAGDPALLADLEASLAGRADAGLLCCKGVVEALHLGRRGYTVEALRRIARSFQQAVLALATPSPREGPRLAAAERPDVNPRDGWLQTLGPAAFRARFGSADDSRALLGYTNAADTHVVLSLLAHARPKRILEVGTALGHMTANLTEFSGDDAVVFTLGTTTDLDAPTSAPQRYETPARHDFGRHANAFGKGGKVFFIVADSLGYDFARLAPLDFAFIDGAHDLEHVLSDSRNAYAALRPGGWLVWHDFTSPVEWVEVRPALERLRFAEPVVHVEGTAVAFLHKGEVGGVESAVVNRAPCPAPAPGEPAGGRATPAGVASPGPRGVASLNLTEALVGLGEKPAAVEGARRLLARLLDGELSSEELDHPRFPPAYDFFRVEWERAAWGHAGDPAGEARAKRELLRWRLHSLLAEHTGEPRHFHEAVLARPDLPTSRAALGCALGAARRPPEAAAHLDFASRANPFDARAARALAQAMLDAGKPDRFEQMKRDRLLLYLSAPAAVAADDWFTQPSRGAAPATAGKLSVLWEGAFLAQHSLGLVSRQLCKGLLARGHELSLVPTASPGTQIEPGEERDLLVSRFVTPLPRSEDVCVRLGWPPRWQPPEQGRWVLFQPWEFGSIPRDWLRPLCEAVDDVWVPTSFVRDGFVRSGVPADRVFVLPLGVDEAVFRPGAEPWPLASSKRFKFLFVGGTIHRKGIDVLLQAYGRAFTHADDVCLVVKDMGVGSFYKGQTAESLIAAFRADADHPEVLHLDGSLTESQMARLYASCDCLVQPYRGEGLRPAHPRSDGLRPARPGDRLRRRAGLLRRRDRGPDPRPRDALHREARRRPRNGGLPPPGRARRRRPGRPAPPGRRAPRRREAPGRGRAEARPGGPHLAARRRPGRAALARSARATHPPAAPGQPQRRPPGRR